MNFTDRELKLLKTAASRTAGDPVINDADAEDLKRLSRIFSNIQNARKSERERERASGYKGLTVYK